MHRSKWSVLVAMTAAFTLTSLAFDLNAQDEKKTKLHELMEKVSATNNKINRVVRTKVTFTKANNGKDVSKEASTLLDLGKEARESEEAFEAGKKNGVENPKEKWIALMDEMNKAIEDLIKNSDAGDFDAAKIAHSTVKNKCAECHKVFKIEEDF
jgi:cytochrome c556